MTDITKVAPLSDAIPTGLNLAATYWTPSAEGETKRLYFIEVKQMNHTDENTGEVKRLNTAVFVDPITKQVIHQSSARLVGVFERELPKPLTAFQITYKGKVKNSTNAFSSDNWEIYRLAIDIPQTNTPQQ